MRLRIALMTVALALCGLWGLPARAADLTVYVTRTPLMTTEDERPSQAVRDWYALLSGRSGVVIDVRVLDFGRAMPLVQQRDDACMAGIVRTAERETLVDWIAPVLTDRIVLAARAPDGFDGDMAALDMVAGGSIAAPEGILSNLLTSRGIRHRQVSNHRTAFRLLLDGRVRFTLVSGILAERMEAQGVKQVADLDPVNSWLACGKKTPAEVKDRLREAHRALATAPEAEPFLALFTARGLTPALRGMAAPSAN
ncbi:amino acid ABC transporter substrate-binding protein [Aerophototrophica crusticola]|uniref:Amino acid ABC transporter substrate-binding protein n=1 Tax=Aerophototrophica crusticola TaxID=1709002 RepID=A0A858R772_9PROT|nr:amino acid ABC transporter substrate-binding protein [Rhodospirillaceae bacterium B3]